VSSVRCAENRKQFRNDSKRGRPPAKLNTATLCGSDLQAAKPPKGKSIPSKREKTSDLRDLSEKRVNVFCRESEKLGSPSNQQLRKLGVADDLDRASSRFTLVTSRLEHPRGISPIGCS